MCCRTGGQAGLIEGQPARAVPAEEERSADHVCGEGEIELDEEYFGRQPAGAAAGQGGGGSER